MPDHQFAYLTSTTHLGFLNAPPLAERPTAELVIAGVPWDGSTTNPPVRGWDPSASGSSHMLGYGWHPGFDVSPADSLADVGDLARRLAAQRRNRPPPYAAGR